MYFACYIYNLNTKFSCVLIAFICTTVSLLPFLPFYAVVKKIQVTFLLKYLVKPIVKCPI